MNRDAARGTAARAVVVHHSGATRLRHCLESLQEQDHPRLGITLVDHSPEGDGAAAAEGLSRVTVLRPPDNTGFGGGVAAALATDDAPVVLLLNPDARAEPAWARRLVETLLADPQAGMAASPVKSGGDPQRLDSAGLGVSRGGTGILRGHGARFPAWSHHREPVPLLGPAGAAAAYRRRALDEAGDMPAVYFLYYEDLETAWRIRRQGWTCAWLDEPLVTHDHVSGAGDEKLYYLHRGRRLFLRRNWPRGPEGPDRTAWFLEESLSWLRAAAAGKLGDARRARVDAELLALGGPAWKAPLDRRLLASTRHLFGALTRRLR